MVSEIKYTSGGASPLQEQFIELYSFVNHTGGTFSGWFIETRSSSGNTVLSKTAIPQVAGLGHFWHLLIFGNDGATTINASARFATVHLNITGTFLNQTAGQVILYHGNNPIVADFVCYGAVQSPVNVPASDQWRSTDTGASITNQSHSLNIWGPDDDDSSNWYSDMPTPGSFNNIIQEAEFTHLDASKENITQVMYNGFLAPNYSHSIATPMLPPGPIIPGLAAAAIAVDADPTAGVTADQIREMVLKTMEILIGAGYKDGPQLGPDGVVDIHIGADTTYNSSYGVCYDNGSV